MEIHMKEWGERKISKGRSQTHEKKCLFTLLRVYIMRKIREDSHLAKICWLRG